MLLRIGDEGDAMTYAKGLVCLMLVLLLGSGAAFAQGVATADLRGTITDPQGAVVSGATVTIRDKTRNFERSTTTNATGDYLLLAVPPGEYEVTVEAQGFARMVTSGVTLTVGQGADLSIELKAAGATEVIEVLGTPELVETQRSTASTTIQQTRIDNLPINGRNYIFFTLTNSQVARDTAPSIGVAQTSGLNFGGQRARSNLVNVDGADAVDNSTNGIRSTVSQEAVQEFQILTNGYAAEYGRASGGVVNIITRRGTNELHGNLFGYLRHRSIQADNPFTTEPDPGFTRVQAGATLGGPIKRDRTFFFFSYETTRRQETGFSTIGSDNFGLVDFVSSTVTCRTTVMGVPTPPFPCPFGTVQLTPTQAGFLQMTNANPNPLFQIAKFNYIAVAGQASGMALQGAWPAALGGLAAFPTSCIPTATPPVLFGCPSMANPVPVPGDYVPLNSLCRLNPAGVCEGGANFPISEGTTVVALRLDHQLNANQQGLLRVNVSPSSFTGIQVNGQNQVFGQNSFSRVSEQTFRDVNVTAQHTWLIGQNKINEFRFQYARRGLLYTFSSQGDSTGPFGDTGTNPDGGQVAINLLGVAYFGREQFSFADRSEQRYQFTDNFSWLKGNHNIKFGADINHIPIAADFTVNFGGLYNFGGLSSASVLGGIPVIGPLFGQLGFPAFSAVQAYGLGIPQGFIQQVGDPSYSEANKTFGFFLQDSWRIKPNFTLNIGVRYDLELTPTEAARTPLAEASQQALGITQGIPRDKNNVAPRIGFAWDPWKDGKTVIRGSYGLFYDHPLFGIAFLSQVADGDQAPGLFIIPGAPTDPVAGCNLNAVNMFQGLLNCPAPFGYLPDETRFDAFLPNSVFVNQNFLNPMSFQPLPILPFGFQTQEDFVYAYSHQASFGIERDMGGNFALSLGYNFNGARHLNRSVNVNTVDTQALIVNWERARLAGAATEASSPLAVAGCGVVPGVGPFVPAALVNFFRPSGINPSLAPVFALNPMLAPCLNIIVPLLGIDPAGQNIFSDQSVHSSIGNSAYHGLTANLRKRFSKKYEFLVSYTWSHAIDSSTDLQSPLAPQDNRRPDLERSRSSFDQRHRFVLSGVYQSGKLSGDGFFSKFFSDWTVAPIVEVSSGRPFNILVGADVNFDGGALTDRPSIVAAGSPTRVGCLPPVTSPLSPTGFFQPFCHNDGQLDGSFTDPPRGNLGRNFGTRPYTVFTDLRLARRFHMTERWKLDVVADMFNIINRFNVADVNLQYEDAGRPTAAFDARQFQFALKLAW